MHPKRRKRLIIVAFLFVGVSATVATALVALNQNLNLFYPPARIVAGEAPVGTQIRAGGMVQEGSVKRTGRDLNVEFVVTDYRGSAFKVMYNGILPDLFREGKGILVRGELGADGIFHAREVLAKHDENYMPPELKSMQASTP